MKHCEHCNGPCEMTPPIYPQRIGDENIWDLKDVKMENIYKLGDWGIDLVRGIKLHKHDSGYYGVFSHYFKQHWGDPNKPVIEPILICTMCEVQIPDYTLNTLQAAYKLWNLKKLPNPVRTDRKERAWEVLQYVPGFVNAGILTKIVS